VPAGKQGEPKQQVDCFRLCALLSQLLSAQLGSTLPYLLPSNMHIVLPFILLSILFEIGKVGSAPASGLSTQQAPELALQHETNSALQPRTKPSPPWRGG
jgi:hypothetical protein